jgi:hypothetical protein
MYEQLLSLSQEPWVFPGVAYGALWLSLIGLKLIYRKIKVASPLAEPQQALFNGLNGFLGGADGWEKLGETSIKLPAKDTRPEFKIIYAGKDEALTLGPTNLNTVLSKKQIKRLLTQAKQIGQTLDQRKSQAELTKLTAALR